MQILAAWLRNVFEQWIAMCQALQCRLWFFSPELFLRRLFGNPDLSQHLFWQRHRSVNDDQTYWGSPAFKLLDQDVDGALTQPRNFKTILLGIGADGVQLLNWGTRTATLIGLRCEDLPGHLRAKKVATFPVIIIEGKSEPHVLTHALRLVVSWFRTYSGAT